MRTHTDTFSKPESNEDCKSLRKCWQCSIYHGAASGEDFFDCFDYDKMKKNVQELSNCF